MSNVEKLKKKAAEHEQKKQSIKRSSLSSIIEQTEGHDDRDVTVYNRVGDLNLRLNKTDQAVNYYEQAVDLYTEGGYLNNAIALCNKILRHAPARHQIYYKLGKISAKKGFNSDAKKNFREYADRMHRAGRESDAFKALEEFADLCPGQDDIRLMLADQLAKAGKNAEAIEQLQILHESLDAEGRAAEASATVQRIHTLDPNVEPRRSKTPVTRDAGGLVFLDVGGSPAKPRPKIEGFGVTKLAPEPPRAAAHTLLTTAVARIRASGGPRAGTPSRARAPSRPGADGSRAELDSGLRVGLLCGRDRARLRSLAHRHRSVASRRIGIGR
jgi:tetratricopeptide (TPR) repeat protein